MFIVVALVFGAGVCACATGAATAVAPVTAARSASGRTGQARLPYRLQVGDEMDVSFYKTPELNTHVKIRPDGKVTLPFVGDVRAADYEPSELASRLEEQYTGELRVPRITVNVTQFAGQRVYVGGEVAQPGVIPLVGQVTVMQAIQQAGGFRDTATLSSVVLIRRSGGAAVGTEVDLSGVASGDSPQDDPFLQAQDIVFVPRSYIADVDLFVDQYVRKILPMTPSFGIGLGTF